MVVSAGTRSKKAGRCSRKEGYHYSTRCTTRKEGYRHSGLSYLGVLGQGAEAGVVPPKGIQVETVGANPTGHKEEVEQYMSPSERGLAAQLAQQAQRRVKVDEHLAEVHEDDGALVQQADGAHSAEEVRAQAEGKGERRGGVVQEARDL